MSTTAQSRGMARTWDPNLHSVAYARCCACGWSRASESEAVAARAAGTHALACVWTRHARRHQHQQERAA